MSRAAPAPTDSAESSNSTRAVERPEAPVDGGAQDRELAIAAAQGDRAAFGRLLDAHAGRVLSVCRRLARDEHHAEDLCQDVFLHLFHALPRYDAARPFRPWLMRVTANACLNRLRAERRRPTVSLDARQDAGAPPLATTAAGPRETAAKRELHARLHAERAALSDEDRLLLALRYEGGLGHAEISESLGGVPLGTIKVRLHRVRKRLAVRLRRFVVGGDT